MANPALPPGALMKSSPAVMLKVAKHRAERREWALTCAAVDERDRKVCYVTGKRLAAGAVDPWLALERHHIQPRSMNRGRRFNRNNIVTVSRAVHQLLHAGILRLLNKRGECAGSYEAIDSVQWDRLRVPKGSEPCRLRKGLAVAERHVA